MASSPAELPAAAEPSDWRRNLITEPAQALSIARHARTVAVLGIKTERQREQPAYFVAEYLQRAGVSVVPVPVFYPEVTKILGQPVFRRVADVPGPVDILDVFRCGGCGQDAFGAFHASCAGGPLL